MVEFYTIKSMAIEYRDIYRIKSPILLKKLKKRTIKNVPGGYFGVSMSQMKVVWCLSA